MLNKTFQSYGDMAFDLGWYYTIDSVNSDSFYYFCKKLFFIVKKYSEEEVEEYVF
ncbi:hypothetical protein [Anaerosalibacter sp. Marseille-P3206]|uniref:hypothetical protein n=1 Tax=Anaerosalibacter sp. Marseille-P3206 TaxID=1871005 RepID=UPI0013566878|nr:hypothetical protein [Anaerosalibacter sp. Marseille-P3206]